MATRDGFQPCLMDTGAPVPMPHWERNLVIVALVVHVMDVGLDLCVAALFVAHAEWVFFLGAAGVIFWAWLVSSLYISFGGGAPTGDIDTDDVWSMRQANSATHNCDNFFGPRPCCNVKCNGKRDVPYQSYRGSGVQNLKLYQPVAHLDGTYVCEETCRFVTLDQRDHPKGANDTVKVYRDGGMEYFGKTAYLCVSVEDLEKDLSELKAQEDAAEEKKRAEEEAEAQKRRDEIFQVLLREEMGEVEKPPKKKTFKEKLAVAKSKILGK
eukprot:g13958.t1